ncbi:AAA family ATPase [Fictibacillus sp. KIGAM418]|uniref:AAA family ATPase n=1 Tax=Fictibacillus marinisediminis TaxID=2878389 RepID=A0A9X2BD50_9BACL|nr:kinase [Fictibacillus marinisediminis]MCK6256315.1 AAA family ATPase [Fictibacillus marinisediminis]
MQINISSIIKKIPKLKTGQRFILGIDGLSRSGKSTLAKDLQHHLIQNEVSHFLIHIDNHIVERELRYHTGREEWAEYYHLQWDVKELTRSIFSRLKTGRRLEVPFYNNDSNTLSLKEVQLPETCLIIIEGVFLQREEWRPFFDYLVYLDCPKETRFLRESERTQQNIMKFQNRYWPAEDYYLKTVRPNQQADLVLYNNHMKKPAL